MIISFTRIAVTMTFALLLMPPASAQQSTIQFSGARELSGASGSDRPADANSAAPSLPTPVAPANAFVIGAEDVLSVNVWKEPDLSSPQVPVRSDGKISLPLIGDVQASGRTPEQLQGEVAARLRDYVASPIVSVIVRDMKSRSFNVLGEVVRPGAFPLQKSTTVVDAVALAGGFREWAKVKSIYVLRRDSGDNAARRIPFNYKKAIRGDGGDFELRPRDTVVVP